MILANAELTTLQSPTSGKMPLDAGQQSIYEACNYVTINATSMWEVRRENVHIVKEIGKGAFSQVAKAEAWNINGIKGLTTVAVKMLKGESLVRSTYNYYIDMGI